VLYYDLDYGPHHLDVSLNYIGSAGVDKLLNHIGPSNLRTLRLAYVVQSAADGHQLIKVLSKYLNMVFIRL